MWLRLGSLTPDSEHYGLPSRQEHSLEVTLESGLDELTVLNDLEELDETNINHRIGVKELEWVHTSWPKLATLAGIFSNHDLAPGTQEWLSQKPEWASEYQFAAFLWRQL